MRPKHPWNSALTPAAMLLFCLLDSGDALAGAIRGQFTVAVRVINACQIASLHVSGVRRLTPALGFGLKCSRGADFVVEVANPPPLPPSQKGPANLTLPTTVTVSF